MASPRYTPDHGGRRFGVETSTAGLGTAGRLFVDGTLVDEQKRADQKIRLEGSGLLVLVRLNWLDQIKESLAVPSGADPRKADTEGIACDPPPGGRAARLEQMKREHPSCTRLDTR